MSRVLTFSRVFPSYHPKAGESTFFVDQIWNSFRDENLALDQASFFDYIEAYSKIKTRDEECFDFTSKKFHTIRSGHRWKAGDWFSPRVWSGKPYNSKQIQFAPDIQVKKIYVFAGNQAGWFLNGKRVTDIASIAANDGLELSDFCQWFKTSFEGQVICWSDSISY